MLVLMWAVHLGIIFYELIKKSVAVLMWAMLLIVFTIPHTAHVYYQHYSDETILKVSLLALLFMLIYIIIRLLYFEYQKKPLKFIDVHKIRQYDKRELNLYFSLYLICFFVILGGLYLRGGSLLNTSWAERVYRNSSIFENMAGLFLTALAGLCFVYFIRKEVIRFIVVLVTYILFLVITQSRYNLLGIVTPFLLYLLLHERKKYLFVGVFSGVFVIFLVFFMQQVRQVQGLHNAFAVGFTGLLQRTLSYMKYGRGELGLIKAFYYFVDQNNSLKDFGQGLGYIRLALLFLPASLFAFKPRDFAIDMYREWYKMDYPKGTMHPTLFGDVYANFGFIGFLMGGFYGILSCITDEVLIKSKNELHKVLHISLFGTMFVLIGRGAIYNSIANCVYSMILLVLIQGFVVLFRRYV